MATESILLALLAPYWGSNAHTAGGATHQHAAACKPAFFFSHTNSDKEIKSCHSDLIRS
jgi:hypothetical protein